jgi:CheY-like chemotaxis protein
MAMDRKRLLVIDDEADNLDVLALMLKEHFDVTSCSSCPQAVQAVPAASPDLLLMDIAMAEIDGIQCLQRIRALPGFATLPAIAVTAYAFPKDKERCLAAGFQAFITKPILDINEVLATIDEILKSGAP